MKNIFTHIFDYIPGLIITFFQIQVLLEVALDHNSIDALQFEKWERDLTLLYLYFRREIHDGKFYLNKKLALQEGLVELDEFHAILRLYELLADLLVEKI